jgi:hypothetical protein
VCWNSQQRVRIWIGSGVIMANTFKLNLGPKVNTLATGELAKLEKFVSRGKGRVLLLTGAGRSCHLGHRQYQLQYALKFSAKKDFDSDVIVAFFCVCLCLCCVVFLLLLLLLLLLFSLR